MRKGVDVECIADCRRDYRFETFMQFAVRMLFVNKPKTKCHAPDMCVGRQDFPTHRIHHDAFRGLGSDPGQLCEV